MQQISHRAVQIFEQPHSLKTSFLEVVGVDGNRQEQIGGNADTHSGFKTADIAQKVLAH